MAEDITRKVIKQAQEDLKNIGPEVAAQPEKGFFGKVLDHLKERWNAIPVEIGDMLEHKVAQGAAELGSALNSQSNAYVPYGVGQAPLEVEGPMVNYQDMLREAQQRAVPEQGREMER